MGDIEVIVKKLIKKYNTSNPFELASCLNVLIFETNLNNTLGMYKYINKNKAIFINNKLTDEVKKFVLAHEIGHAVLHTKNNCFYLKHNTFIKTNYFEIEANKFAAALLIPDEDLNSCIENNFTIEQTASYFQVPVELVKYKLNK